MTVEKRQGIFSVFMPKLGHHKGIFRSFTPMIGSFLLCHGKEYTILVYQLLVLHEQPSFLRISGQSSPTRAPPKTPATAVFRYPLPSCAVASPGSRQCGVLRGRLRRERGDRGDPPRGRARILSLRWRPPCRPGESLPRTRWRCEKRRWGDRGCGMPDRL